MQFLETNHLEPRLFVAVFLDTEQAQSNPKIFDGILKALQGISRDWRVLLVAKPLDARCRHRMAETLSRSLIWVEYIPEPNIENCIAHAALVVTDCPDRAKTAAQLGVRCLFLGKNELYPLVELGWVIQHEPENPLLLLQRFDEVIRVRARIHSQK